jgi:hypothetical protein
MAGSRVPSPLGSRHHQHAKHPGLAAGSAPAFPGHICLFQKIPKQPPKKVLRIPVGMRVNGESQISADAWVQKIKDCTDVPTLFNEWLQAQGQIIFVVAPKGGTAADEDARSWLRDWRAALTVNEWEVTTALLDIAVKKTGTPGKPQRVHITTVLHPDLSGSDSIDPLTEKISLTEEYDKSKAEYDKTKFAIQKGATMPAGTSMQSGRKLIAIANRITLRLEGKANREYVVTDDEIVNIWFHEIACHAGLQTQGKPCGHGDPHVEDTYIKIDRMIPGEKTGQQVFKDVDAFLTS